MAGVRARPASCTPANTASRRLQDIYKKANAAEVVSWQFFAFHIIKTSERTNNPIRHLHPILSEGNPSASHNTLPMPPRDSNITSRAPLVSRTFLDISAMRGGAEAETKGGGVEIFTNHGGELWEGGPPPSRCFGDGWGWLGMVGWLDGWTAGWLHDWMVGWLDGWMVA